MSPMSCLEVPSSNKVVLFNHTLPLTTDGMAVKTLEERINYGLGGGCPGREGRDAFREGYTKLTVRKIVVWRRQAMESLIKKTIALGANDILPNFVAGRMDTTEGTYVWNYTVRSCLEEELEELDKGSMEVFKAKNGSTKGGSVVLDGFGGSLWAWLKMGRGVTICGRKMRQTHLPHMYMKGSNLDRKKDASKRYGAPAEERELESLSLEWSYLEGWDDYLLHRTLQEIRTAGCWVTGTLTELRQLQMAGGEGYLGIANRFGPGHLVLRNGETAYVARCGMVVVEVRNQTICTQEIPMTFRGEKRYVEPFTLVLQSTATRVN
jgi:hypothetical protein